MCVSRSSPRIFLPPDFNPVDATNEKFTFLDTGLDTSLLPRPQTSNYNTAFAQ
jgi:hypothetical protein